MTSDIYIFAGGGTGGHLYPGLAVAAELMNQRPQAQIVFACSYRAIDRQILDSTPYAVVPQPIRPAPRLGGVWEFLSSYVRSGRQARDMVRDLRPRAVLGLGGFAGVPLVRAAHKARVPTAFLNPDEVPGKANRFLASRAEVIFAQFGSTAAHFPPALRGKVRATGCPIRSEFFASDREAALREWGLRPDRRTLLVNGGSLGAQSINDAVLALAAELDALADSWQVLHVTGPGKQGSQSLAACVKRIPVVTLEYCRRMDLALAAADLSLCRAGASTVAELCAAGRPAIILPYPYHKDQHQKLNARALADKGAAEVVEDRIGAAANAASLREKLIPLMADGLRLEKMRQAAGGLGRPRAAADVADWLANQANGGTGDQG